MKRKEKAKTDPEAPTMGHQYPDKLTKVSLQIKETVVDLLQIFVPASVTEGLDYDGLTLDTLVAATAATSTMVSPNCTVTAPSACLASFPVSIWICLSPTWAVTCSGIT